MHGITHGVARGQQQAGALELISKELNHFGGITSFFRDWVPGTLTGGA